MVSRAACAEWSLAAGIPSDSAPVNANPNAPSTLYVWGTDWPPPANAGNFHPSLRVDPYYYTSPVGVFKPNALGLYDVSGNACEIKK